MPSIKNPITLVIPGPGKLLYGEAQAGAFGGAWATGNEGLAAHIGDAVDAHIASAIGINPTTALGEAILSSVGGPVDGESLRDFVWAVKDLYPIRPDTLGVNNLSVVNSGVPDWAELNASGDGSGTAITGAFVRGGSVVYTHTLVPSTVANLNLQAMVYPADRGVLAMYNAVDGDYTTGTLVSALWLGSTAPPAGIPTAGFDETLRTSLQAGYTGSGAGIDNFSLGYRLPYLRDYAGTGSPWVAFNSNFYRYQIGQVSYTSPLTVGDAGSWLLVHWKETYATSLASIQPAELAAHLTPTYCYSATTPNHDETPGLNMNRHNVFLDEGVAPPSGTSFTTGVDGGAPTPMLAALSGVLHYAGGNLRWDVDMQAAGLFDHSFYPGTSWSPSGPPDGYQSAYPPVTLDMTEFGQPTIERDTFSELRDPGTGNLYTTANPPGVGAAAQLLLTNHAFEPIGTTPVYPTSGYCQLKSTLRKPFVGPVVYTDPTKYLFNSYPQTGVASSSTTTLEPFCDEKYRYKLSTNTSLSLSVEPAAGDKLNSVTVLSDADTDLQVAGNRLIYPHIDYSSGYLPVGPDYANLKATETLPKLRQYMRCFDTGSAVATGKLRIVGLPAIAFTATAGHTGNDVTDQPNGAKIELIAGGNGVAWNLGRPTSQAGPPLCGCQVGVVAGGPNEIIVEYSGPVTQSNGMPQPAFPLFVKVTFIHANGNDGTALYIDEMEWLPA